jgi:hypothetical protein
VEALCTSRFILTYFLTPWNRFLLEKLTGLQLVKKLTTFYETRRFITAFTIACLFPELPQSSPYPHIAIPKDPSDYYPPIYTWVYPVVSFSQVYPPKTYTPLSPPPTEQHATPISFRILSPHNSGWGVEIMELLYMKVSPHPRSLLHIKYYPCMCLEILHIKNQEWLVKDDRASICI